MSRGRPPKTTAEHIEDGTYREDRHGGRLDAFMDSGLPTPPFKLSDDERWAWNLACNHLPPSAICEMDSLALYGLVKFYGRWLKLMQYAEGNPQDLQGSAMAIGAWKQVSQMLGRFGMTPADRAKIQMEPLGEDESEEREFQRGLDAELEAEISGNG